MNTLDAPSRRRFLKSGALIGGGLVVGFVVPGAKRFAAAAPAAAAAASAGFAPNAFLRVGSDDTVTVLLSHSEMGQGIWTGLAMLIAEELDADWSKIKVEHAPAAPAYAHTMFGMQMTGGSTSTWTEFERYRMAGATARALLLAAASKRLGVPAEQLCTENGAVIAGSRRLRYGELAAAAAALPPPATPPLAEDAPRPSLPARPEPAALPATAAVAIDGGASTPRAEATIVVKPTDGALARCARNCWNASPCSPAPARRARATGACAPPRR